MSNIHHLERLALDRFLNQAAANGADGDADRLHGAVDLDLDALEVGLELAFGNAGDFAADPAQVFGLAAATDLIAANRFLSGNRALHPHRPTPPRPTFFGPFHYSEGLCFDKNCVVSQFVVRASRLHCAAGTAALQVYEMATLRIALSPGIVRRYHRNRYTMLRTGFISYLALAIGIGPGLCCCILRAVPESGPTFRP